jgi:16S rRNA (guanine1516-N2)-methyltransferase
MKPDLALYCESSLSHRRVHAAQLAIQLDLSLLASLSEIDAFPYCLIVTDQQLGLRHTQSKTKPICVDFLSAAFQYRSLTSNKHALIAKAVGIHKHKNLSVIDATAGLGQDGFVLHGLGCTVHYLERSPIVAALLQAGLDHYASTTSHKTPSLTQVDARLYLEQLEADAYPDVIYLDPMFPARKKATCVKKEMRILRDIVGEDTDIVALFEMALRRAKKRVVVKRLRLAPMLTDRKPDLVLHGQNVRFDVYTART